MRPVTVRAHWAAATLVDNAYALCHHGGMRLLKMMLIVAVVLALFQPAMFSSLVSATGEFLTRTANAASETHAAYRDEDAHGQACLLFEGWEKADSRTRTKGAAAVAALAREQASRTDDSAVRALLAVVPDAVGAGNRARSRTARVLLTRECGLEG